MSLYTIIYDNLCEKHIPANIDDANTHIHHKIPKHAGGRNTKDNLVRLTVREHIIAHFLLWKINRNPNDLRAMYMLGANLSSDQRKKTGEMCRDRKLGFFKATDQQRKEWALRGYHSQKQQDDENSFYWWSTPAGRKKRASMGGTASFKSGNNEKFIFWSSPEGRKKRASMGGKSHINKKAMFKPGDTTFIRVPLEKISEYLKLGYVLGSPHVPKSKGTKTGKISCRRRKVTNTTMIFESVTHAAAHYNVSPATILNWCKSKKHVNWYYVS
jgi:hypothetical protein